MSMQELMQAFGMFKQSVQEAATTNAVNDATAQMQQIKTGITDQAQQRVALQGLSDQLALRLTGVGAPASTIQTAFQAIAPQQFGSVEQMDIEGQLSGDKQLQKVAGKMKASAQQAKMAQLAYEAGLKAQLQQQELMGKMQIEGVKAGLQRKDLKSEEIKTVSEATDTLEQLEKLQTDYNAFDTMFPRTGFGRKDIGPDAATFEASNKQFFNSYKKFVTGTAASDKELEDLLQSVPNVKDSPWAYQAKLSKMKSNVEMLRNRKVVEYKAAGRDVSGFEQMYEEERRAKALAQERFNRAKAFSITGE